MSFLSNLSELVVAISFSGDVLICTHPLCYVAILREALDRHLYRVHHLDKAVCTGLIAQVPPGSYVESSDDLVPLFDGSPEELNLWLINAWCCHILDCNY